MISRSGIHSIRALAHLARLGPGKFAGSSALAGEIGAPANYLGKLLQSMARAGLVESRKGLGGGFRLRPSPESITLLDVLEPIEQISRWQGCFMGAPRCSETDPCAVHDRWDAVRAEYLRLLAETTIATFVESNERQVASNRSPRSSVPDPKSC